MPEIDPASAAGVRLTRAWICAIVLALAVEASSARAEPDYRQAYQPPAPATRQQPQYDPRIKPAEYIEPANIPRANQAHAPQAAAPRAEQRLAPPAEKAIPLAPPKKQGSAGATGAGGAMATMLASLTVVLGCFFVVAWLLKRGSPAAAAALPADAFEVLGRAPLAARQHAHLLRIGNRLLLVAIGTDTAQTLVEIDDPDEVTRLAGLCRQNHPHSATSAFRDVLRQFHKEKTPPGFVGAPTLARTPEQSTAREATDV